MTTNFLFSGADVTGRDDLLGSKPRTVRPSPAKAKKPAPVLARSTAVFAIATSVFFASSLSPVLGQAADVADVSIRLDAIDPIAARILTTSSDGVAPNGIARQRATQLLEALRAQSLEPSHVLADPDGGISLYVFGPEHHSQARRYARLLATNENDVIVTFENPAQTSRHVWELKPAKLSREIDRVGSFVRGRA